MRKNNIMIWLMCFGLAMPNWSMDVDPLPMPTLSREETLEEIIELMDSNARIFEIYANLAWDVAQRYFKNEGHEDLMEEAKKWMGSTSNFGKEHDNWPAGLREDNLWIGLNMVVASEYYIGTYSTMKTATNHLKFHGFNENSLWQVENFLKEGIAKVTHSDFMPQTQQEIEQFGEYPEVDKQALMLGPWQEILQKIALIRAQYGVQSSSAVFEDKYRETPQALLSKALNITKLLADTHDKVEQALNWYQNYFKLTYEWDGRSDIACSNVSVAENLLKFRTPAMRYKVTLSKINLAFTAYENYLKSLPHLMMPDDINVASVEVKAEHRQEKKSKPLNHKGKNKPKKKSQPKKKPQAKKNAVITKDSEDENKEASAEDENDNAGVTCSSPSAIAPMPKTTAGSFNASSSTTSSSTSQKNKKWKQPTKVKPEPKPVTSKPAVQYSLLFNPYLTKDVVEKFLDIFGNMTGETSLKPGRIYQRKGWGTIDDLEKVLTGAKWLINQRETAIGIVNEKHKSSTISFRMPNSSKTMSAPRFRFHDDHKSRQNMREIARHFIVKNLESFGYTEDFLEHYYKIHF